MEKSQAQAETSASNSGSTPEQATRAAAADSQVALTTPAHIGFIVDGNRRWAREKGLPTLEGHRRGFDRVEEIAENIFDKGVKFASFYLFSTENWNRSEEEVSYLMDLLRKKIESMAKKLQKKGIKMVWQGREDPAPADVIEKIRAAEAKTAAGTKGTVVICFNYGGHWEIADAAAKFAADYAKGAVAPTLTPDGFAKYLYQPDVPPCDLIVRTSGEQRISGFQLWRAAYSEFLFLDKKFPDMSVADLDDIIAEFGRRSRRFGK